MKDIIQEKQEVALSDVVQLIQLANDKIQTISLAGAVWGLLADNDRSRIANEFNNN